MHRSHLFADFHSFRTPNRDATENDDIIEEHDHSETSEKRAESIHRNLDVDEPSPPAMTRMNLSLRNLHSLQGDQRPLTNGTGRGNASTIDVDSDTDQSEPNHSHRMSGNRTQQQHQYQPQPQQQLPQLQPAHDKFRAFGQFVASSLIDLPEKSALELVEKFTREIVQTLIAVKTPAPTTDQ